jgi:hypothetical protein
MAYVHRVHIGAPPDGTAELPRRLERYLAPIGALAVRAALSIAPRAADPDRVGIFSATGPSRFDVATLGEKMLGVDGRGPLWEGALGRLEPFALLKLMSSGALAVLSMALPARGPSHHGSDGALGGLEALRAAAHALARGAIDHALVLAFDDLSSRHARAEHRGIAVDEPRQVAALALSTERAGALAAIESLEIRHDGGAGPFGAAAGLATLARAIVDGTRGRVEISVDGGRATLRLGEVRP